VFALALLPQMLAADSQNSLDFSRGNVLYAACMNTNSTYQVACHAYIEGVTQGYYSTDESRRNVLMPEGVSYGQIDDVVVNYLNKHPENRLILSALLIIQALHEAWPAKWND
jgi:Rap1a immunity proteins